MFKSITAFKIANTATRLALLNPDLGEVLEEHGAPDPHATQWASYGYVRPKQFGQSHTFDGSMGTRVICVRRSERILPGKVIKQELDKKVKHVEQKEGRNCHRKEIAGFKDDVIARLLPKAFIKSTDYLLMITGDYLLVDCSSVKLVDEMVAFLADTLYSAGFVTATKLRPLQSRGVARWLKEVALGQQAVSTDEDECPASNFQHLDSATLKGDGVVRLKDLEFDSEVGVAALASKMHFMELAVAWGSEPGTTDIHCSINDSLLIKRVKFSDVLLKQAKEDSDSEDEVSHFDATVAIMAGLLKEFIEQLAEATGANEELEEEDEEDEQDSGLLSDFEVAIGRAAKHIAEIASSDGDEEDSLYEEGVAFVRESGKASISAVQRKLRIGYNRAARLIETMYERGVVSDINFAGVREVLTPKPRTSVDDFDRELEDDEL